MWRCPTISELMINEEIRDKEVRLIDEEGNQLGVVPVKEALAMARERNLDLVKIAPQAKPPVCKILNYGKYRFEQIKREKEAKKKQNGDKVKVSVRFRGRELSRTEIGREVLDDFTKGIAEVGDVEKPPKMEGRSMVMFLMPKH